VVGKLKQNGVVALPVAQSTNYLYANFVTDSVVTDDVLKSLLQLKKQLIWLNLANTNANDSTLATVAQLNNLTRLHLENTFVSDKGLLQLKNLSNLQYLNLVGTKITSQGVIQLKSLPRLQQLYLYQTNISRNDFATIKNVFRKTYIDSGGYIVPTLATDTTEVKAKKEY